MLTIKHAFTLELTTDEIDIITDGLALLYKDLKEDAERYPDADEKRTAVRDLRNDFAAFVNRHFMGADA